MKQLRISEPWADVAYQPSRQTLDDLVARIQLLEARVRELEQGVADEKNAAPVAVSVGA